MTTVSCPQGHDSEIDVPLDEDVRWECPLCQGVSVLRATESKVEVPDDIRHITEGDSGSASDTT